MRKVIILTLLLAIATLSAHSQQAISIRPIIYGYHPYDDPNNAIAPKAKDLSGTFTMEPGAILSYEYYFISRFLGVKLNTAAYIDNAHKLAGFTHLGLRLRTHSTSQSFMITFGPAFFFRKAWYDIEGYTDDGNWSNGEEYQTKFSPFAMEFEFAHTFGKKHSLLFSFSQINPKAYTFAVGYSYYIAKSKNRNRRLRKKSRYYRRKR